MSATSPGLPMYWKRRDVREINSAESFGDLSRLIIKIAKRMRTQHPGQPIVEVCGPISTGGLGDTAQNLQIFAKSIELLRDEGHVVIDQMPFESHMGRLIKAGGYQGYCKELLEQFYGPLLDSRLMSMTAELWAAPGAAPRARRSVAAPLLLA